MKRQVIGMEGSVEGKVGVGNERPLSLKNNQNDKSAATYIKSISTVMIKKKGNPKLYIL